MFFRQVAGILLILAAGVLPAIGQTRTPAKNIFSIAGSVRDDSSQLTLENVRVDLKSTTDVGIRTTFTRQNGEFEFDGLSGGDYSIEVDEKDYEPVQQTVTIYNAPLRGVTIFLSKHTTILTTRSSGAMISAHQLSAPRKAQDEFNKGVDLLYTKSDFQGSISQFQRAIKDFPTYYEAYAEEGQAYFRLKQMALAEEAMKKSIDLSSGRFSEALFMLSALLNDVKRFEDSATVARQGINVDPSSWQGPFELARALSGLHQKEEAEKNAVEARDLKPDNPAIYLLLANIHIQMRNYPALEKDLVAYLKLVPSGPEADQARQTQIELQAAMRDAAKQQGGQIASNTTGSPHPEIQLDPEPEPDSSGLPSLPPPTSNTQ